MLSMILATDLNGGIGTTDKSNKGLCWHVKEDMQRFILTSKQYKQLVAGTTTYNLLKNLPERILYRLTDLPYTHNDLSLIDLISESETSNFLVIGGKQTYLSVKPFCTKIYLSEIQHSFTNCTVFMDKIELLNGFKQLNSTTIKTSKGLTVIFSLNYFTFTLDFTL